MIQVKFEDGLYQKLVAAMYVTLIGLAVKVSKIQYDMWMVYRDLKHGMKDETIVSFEVPDNFVYIAMYAILGAATFMFIRKMRRHHEPR